MRFNNPQGVGTGGYGDGNLADERLWAAAELYRTIGPQNWGNVGTMGLWTYALGKGKNAEALGAIRKDSIAAAGEIVKRAAQNGYQIPMTPRDYVWGSYRVVGNYGLQLLVANVFKPNPAYVTQVGSNPFMNPHHRPSAANEIAINWQAPLVFLMAGVQPHL